MTECAGRGTLGSGGGVFGDVVLSGANPAGWRMLNTAGGNKLLKEIVLKSSTCSTLCDGVRVPAGGGGRGAAGACFSYRVPSTKSACALSCRVTRSPTLLRHHCRVQRRQPPLLFISQWCMHNSVQQQSALNLSNTLHRTAQDPVYFVDPKPDEPLAAPTQQQQRASSPSSSSSGKRPSPPSFSTPGPSTLKKVDLSHILGNRHAKPEPPVSYKMVDDMAQVGCRTG